MNTLYMCKGPTCTISMRRENTPKMKSINVVEPLRVFIVSMSLVFLLWHSNGVMGSPMFPAMFVFGDSLVDCGNNNYITSLAKSNYYPYGIDFSSGPTGRFCNGETIIDFLGNFFFVCFVKASTLCFSQYWLKY